MAQTMTRPGPQPIRRPPRRLPFPLSIYQTAVGKKWVMALTGIGLLGYVLVHMIGNLHLYEGPVEIHEYAESLRDLGVKLVPRTWLLWALRIGLITMFVVHIHAAVTLSKMSIESNTGYAAGTDGQAGDPATRFASRTMRWTGPIILLYLFYHLADLTWGWWPWVDYQRGDPYHNVVESLENWPVALLYIAANVALAVHIFHGAWSIFQSLGLNNPRYNQLRRAFAAGFAGVILAGNLSFPILVQAGLVDEDNCEAPCGLTGVEEEAR